LCPFVHILLFIYSALICYTFYSILCSLLTPHLYLPICSFVPYFYSCILFHVFCLFIHSALISNTFYFILCILLAPHLSLPICSFVPYFNSCILYPVVCPFIRLILFIYSSLICYTFNSILCIISPNLSQSFCSSLPYFKFLYSLPCFLFCHRIHPNHSLCPCPPSFVTSFYFLCIRPLIYLIRSHLAVPIL
jgi:hypothetical protein